MIREFTEFTDYITVRIFTITFAIYPCTRILKYLNIMQNVCMYALCEKCKIENHASIVFPSHSSCFTSLVITRICINTRNLSIFYPIKTMLQITNCNVTLMIIEQQNSRYRDTVYCEITHILCPIRGTQFSYRIIDHEENVHDSNVSN